MWHHVFVETSSETISLIKFIEANINSIRNQDSFIFEDYSEQLRDNPHLGKELSILYFEHQESEKTSSKEVWSLFNKTLIEPWGFKVCFKAPEISSQPSWRLQTFFSHFCNLKKSSLASWPFLNDIWRSSFLLEKKAPLFLTDTFL